MLLKEGLSAPEISLQYIMLNTKDLCFKFCLMLFLVLFPSFGEITSQYKERGPSYFQIHGFIESGKCQLST